MCAGYPLPSQYNRPRYAALRFYTVFRMGTQLACRTVFAGLRIAFVFPVTVAVGGTVFQDTVLRTDNAIIIFVVYKFSPFMSALHRHRSFVAGIQHSAVIKYFLCNMRCFVCTVGHYCRYLGKELRHLVINIIECYAVVDIAWCWLAECHRR